MPEIDAKNTGKVRGDFYAESGSKNVNNSKYVCQNVSSLRRISLRPEPTRHNVSPEKTKNQNGSERTLPSRRRGSPRSGDTNGDSIRQARGRNDLERPNFNIEVPPNGYAWWYIDGINKAADRGVSVIGFIGSVFSPWYKWSGRRDPENHVCINVATYGPGGRFTMTDRGRSALKQSSDFLRIGPSNISWDNGKLVISVDEISSLPAISRVKGTIVIEPSAISKVELPLTEDGTHVWRPFAPNAKIYVELNRNGWQWQGHGYFDANFGTKALEEDFSYWTWGRYPTENGCICFYDALRRDGTDL